MPHNLIPNHHRTLWRPRCPYILRFLSGIFPGRNLVNYRVEMCACEGGWTGRSVCPQWLPFSRSCRHAHGIYGETEVIAARAERSDSPSFRVDFGGPLLLNTFLSLCARSGRLIRRGDNSAYCYITTFAALTCQTYAENFGPCSQHCHLLLLAPNLINGLPSVRS